MWKRRNATLAYEWDVDTFEDTEVDRPQFVGTSVRPVRISAEKLYKKNLSLVILLDQLYTYNVLEM